MIAGSKLQDLKTVCYSNGYNQWKNKTLNALVIPTLLN